MKPNNLKIRLILAAILYSLLTSFVLHAATFKFRPVVMSGDLAPEGAPFTLINIFSMNNPGAIAFIGSTQTSRGIYLSTPGGTVSDRTITRAIKPGDLVRVPEHIPAGQAFRKEPTVDPNQNVYIFPDGHRYTCNQTRRVEDFGTILFMNDSGDIAFGRTGFIADNVPPTLFSGGALTDLSGCPGVIHLLQDLIPRNFDIFLSTPAGINNAGTILFDVRTIETLPAPQPPRFRGWPFFVTGGNLRLQSLPSLPVGINDSGNLLFTSGGIFIDSTPVAVIGGPTGDGRTFRQILAVDMNNRGEVAFVAVLSDSRRALFRWSNGTLTLLVREGDPSPIIGFPFFDMITVRLNDNGDIIFRATAGPRSGIFHRSATGALSKVVLPGDTLPGDGNFTVIGGHEINNRGQIAFVGVLSTGKHGIFIASGGLETEFVDPVPDLLVGPAVKSGPPADLAKMGRVVTGIAADGAAQVVVRVKTGQAGRVEFSLTEEGGGVELPANSFNGSLSQVGQSTGSSTVSVDTKNIDGVGPMAFAAYHAPDDYARNPRSSEAGEPDRKVFIWMRLRTSTGETVESTESLRIVRPPVVLVHGIWSFARGWDNFAPLIDDPKFFIRRVDYEKTNARQFSVNAPIVLRQLKPRIDVYKAAKGVAAVRADVVTHSMGGLMARMLPLSEDGYFREDNFNLGDVHKVINFGTPNFGTSSYYEALACKRFSRREVWFPTRGLSKIWFPTAGP